MELREYLKIFSRYRGIIIASVAISIVLAITTSIARLQQSEASFSLIVRPKAIEKTENFQFTDALEASDRVTRMTENWLNEKQLGISTRRLGNQFIAITLSAQSEQAARAQMEHILIQTNAFLSSLSATQVFASFESLATDFSFERKNPFWSISLTLGIIIGLLAGLFGALLAHYLA